MSLSDQQIKNAALHLDAVFAAALDAMIVTDARGIITMFNSAAEQMFGYSQQEVIGHSVSMFMPPHDGLYHQMYMDRYIETRQSRIPRKGREVIAKRRNGETFFADIAISDVELDGEMIFTAIIRDITARKNKEQRIVRLAFFDQETGLPNAYYLCDKLEDILKEPQTDYCLISLYIGELTDYVNIFGVHGVKDVIIGLNDELMSKLPTHSLITRCGLRHLKIIYAADKNKPLSIEQIAEQLKSWLEHPIQVANHHIFLSAIFGITTVTSQQDTVRLLLDHADIALHIAKRRIDRNYEIFKTEFEYSLHRRAIIVQKLYNSIKNMPFELYLQPQICLSTSEIIGVEALIRWQDEDGQWILPAEFIPIAETMGLIKDITLWTVQQACCIIKNWYDTEQKIYRVAVNISAHVICSDAFVQDVISLINQYDIDPQNLELEITETALMMNLDTAMKTVADLSALGISIAIDDFGTGLSSLAYLRNFRIDRLKIDRSFIINISNDNHDRTLVEAIIRLSHALGYKVVCEGVEHKEQLGLLKQLSCDETQGYYFARPMPVADFFIFAKNFHCTD
jgi:PAS domain S-box-containing protein